MNANFHVLCLTMKETSFFIFFLMMVVFGTTWACLGYFMATFYLPLALVFVTLPTMVQAIGTKSPTVVFFVYCVDLSFQGWHPLH